MRVKPSAKHALVISSVVSANGRLATPTRASNCSRRDDTGHTMWTAPLPSAARPSRSLYRCEAGKYLPLTAPSVRLSTSAMNCSIYGLGLVASGISLVMIISAAPAAPPQQIARAAHQGAALLQIVFMSPPSRRLIRLFACRAPDGA